MPNYSFKETILYISGKLNVIPPESIFEKQEAELLIDGEHLLISKGSYAGSIHFSLSLGLLVQPIRETCLKELAASNFLGINTGGCKLALDDEKASLSLKSDTTPGTHPQESWEWLHRMLNVAREWYKILEQWEEFVPLGSAKKEEPDGV
ncbi:MAG: hypothetical protein S4CHLAM123_08650 [Chlamydiales bacterium]|nr:hypothetical protein [Chlamydiales bacterium]